MRAQNQSGLYFFKLHLYEEFESPRLDADFSRNHDNIIDGKGLLSKVNVM